jgi:hypothetical protein
MPSSITLTVSHLPTSTSFFLSALQPLRYGYRGRADQTVGFGPVNSSAPADFWITQECPGIPAGAAHVAFPAPSRDAVQDFFHAALKAGATIHGEPCTRDAHGYYSAAIIDFDGNSIEAVHRPGFGNDNKENYASTVVSKRSSSRASATVSRAPSTNSKALTSAPTTVSKAHSVAHDVPNPAGPVNKPQGDALETLLNQARSTADVARKLVEQVRPRLPASSSTPSLPAATREHTPNPDAFAKPGDGGNAVIGTLLGVAAGAALTYAFTNSRKDSPESNEDSHSQRSRRPSIAGRSATAPVHQISRYRALDDAPSHYITMNDHDTTSTIKPTTRRRSSVDSGLGISPPSTTSRSSRRTGPRLIEAPPTSYKAPTVITQAQPAMTGQRHTRTSRSKTRQPEDPPASQPCSSSASSKHRRSRSESRSRHARHDSGISIAPSGYETVLHVTTQRSYGPSSGSPPSARWGANKHFPLPNESVSSTRPTAPARIPLPDSTVVSASTAKRDGKKRSQSRSGRGRSGTAGSGSDATRTTAIRPEGYPLPPSRAATWTAGGPGSSSNSKAESFVSARSGGGAAGRGWGGAGGGDGGAGGGGGTARTVIGKMREVEGLRVKRGAVRPEDSVSQVSSVRSGRSGRR